MKFVKPIAVMAVAACLALGIAGCGSSGSSSAASSSASGSSASASASASASGSTSSASKDAAVANVDELIAKIQVQERTDTTDADCKAAKAAWDALTDAQKAQVEEADYFGLDTGDASKDDPLAAAPDKENEILVVSFGTSFNDSRVATIGAVEKAIQAAIPTGLCAAPSPRKSSSTTLPPVTASRSTPSTRPSRLLSRLA